MKQKFSLRVVAAVALALLSSVGAHAAPWEPTKPIEFVVPAGTGGGADQMARFIQGVVAKHKLSPQPIIVVNKSGGAGAEGFLDVKGDKGNPHKIVITLSTLTIPPTSRHTAWLIICSKWPPWRRSSRKAGAPPLPGWPANGMTWANTDRASSAISARWPTRTLRAACRKAAKNRIPQPAPCMPCASLSKPTAPMRHAWPACWPM